MTKETKPTFEEAVTRLEELIEAMEDGSAPLAELVAKYEEGSKILKGCQEQLQAAELKIEKLNLGNGEPEPFHTEE
ncbi:MAG: exodeoxyribonuclease VII small subunit [Opitutales bacterium]